MTYYNKTPFESILDDFGSCDLFAKLLDEAIVKLRLNRKEARELRVLTGLRPVAFEMTLADILARRQAARFLGCIFEEAYDVLNGGEMRFYELSFLTDIGITPEQAPDLRVTSVKHEMAEALRSMDLSGLAFLQLDPIYNDYNQNGGRTLVLHGRALCWRSGSDLLFERARNELNAAGSLRCKFDVTSIFSRPLRHGATDVLAVAASFARFPTRSAIIAPLMSGGWDLCSTLFSFHEKAVIRVVEGLSHMPVYDAVFAVGEAAGFYEAWENKLEHWHAERLYFDHSGVVGGLNLVADPLWESVRRIVPSYYQAPYNVS